MRDTAATSRPCSGFRTAALLLAATLLAACDTAPEPPVVACDLNAGPCVFADGRGRIEFQPRPLPLMRPIAVRLDYPGEASLIRIDFRGTTMDMGFNQATLRRDADGVYRGTAMLPLCATGAMRWRADLLVDQAGAPLARFEFDTAPDRGSAR